MKFIFKPYLKTKGVLYNRISYGVYSPHLEPVQDISRREFNLLIALLIPTVVLGIFPNVVLDSIHLSVTTLLYYYA